MGWISHHFFTSCFVIIYLCCNTSALLGNHILHNIGKEALETIDLQSHNVSVSFDGNQWIAILTCEFQNNISADVSWHVHKTGKRIDSDNSFQNMVVTNIIISEGTIQSTLTINNFTYDDVDQYTCLLAEPKGYTNHTLWVAPKPTIEYDDPGIIVEKANTTVSIPCISFRGAPLFFRLPCIQNLDNCYQDMVFLNVTQPGDVNETQLFTFTANQYASSNYFQCCMQMPSNQQPHQCTIFPVYVKGDISTYQPGGALTACSNATNKCILGGVFFSYPFLNESSIRWTVDDGNITNANITDPYEVFPRGLYISSRTEVTLDPSKTYVLTASGNDCINSYNFTLGEEQFTPILTSTPTVNLTDNQGSFSAKFTCWFTASPPPNIFWYKLPINGLSTVMMIQITNTSLPGYNIYNRWFPATKQMQTVLQIPNYENADIDTFLCIAENNNGIGSSKPLAAYKRIDDFQLNINSTSTAESNLIVANCSASGYPPPNINWKIAAEFDIKYTINDLPDYDLGTTISSATIVGDGGNSFVDIECVAFTQFEPILRKRARKTIEIVHKTEVFPTICTPDQFKDGVPCTMTCEFQSNNASALIHWDWNYFVENPSDRFDQPSALIDANKNFQKITPYRIQTSLTINDYNAGWYRCWAVYHYVSAQTSAEVAYYNFQIGNTETGSGIGDPCTESHECITLYAICLNSRCQCSDPNSIPLDNTTNTMKCLKPAGPGKPCITDAQCEAGKKNYVCRNNPTIDDFVCTCIGYVRNVKEEGGEEMCIQEASYDESCEYDEQCQIADVNMQCNGDLECKCSDDYTYDSYFRYCVYKTQGHISTAGVVAIVIAVILAAALLASVIGGIIKKRRLRPSRNAMSSRVALSTNANDSSSDLPYAEFSDMSLRVDGASNASDDA